MCVNAFAKVLTQIKPQLLPTMMIRTLAKMVKNNNQNGETTCDGGTIMDNDVRLADLAICCHRMLIALLHLIWSNGYSQHNHPAAAVELMLVSFATAIATRDGRSLSATDISHELEMPYSNVRRHLDALLEDGRVKRVSRRYVHDLDRLDEIMSSLENLDRNIEIVGRCMSEWGRLRPLLLDRLK